VADFTGSPTSGEAPLTVSFTDQSTDATSWDWDFGDGGTSTAQSPSHQYSSAGTYTVTLTATNSCGSDVETKTDYITVSEPCVAPVADFTGNPTSGEAPLTVSFTDQSSNSPTSWSWDFGDGGTSTAQNPSHQYGSAGTYTVSLTATNACGSDVETKTDYITVTAPSQDAMHVNAINVSKDRWWILYRGYAEVQVVDQNGNPVSNATVSGQWSGGASDSDQFTTNANGWGTCVSNWRWGNATFTFCITNITKSGYVYDSGANVLTCKGTDGSTSAVKTVASSEVDLDEIEEALGHPIAGNYPNPFNPSTEIAFFIPEPGHVTVDIYNVLGQKVIRLMDTEVDAGFRSVTWNSVDSHGKSVASGVYFYRISLDNVEVATKNMMLVK
jgi:PKD repeat protein